MFSVTDPHAPQLRYIHTFEPGRNSLCTGSAIAGQIGFFAVGGKLFIGDISSPNAFTQLSVISDQNISCVALSGNFAYCGGVFNNSNMLMIFNVSDPANPILMSTLHVTCSVSAIGIWGNYAFVAGDGNYIHTVNIANPANPILTGSCASSSSVYKIESRSGHITVYSYYGLHIYNSSDPANLVLVGTYNLLSSSSGMVERENYLYVAQYSCLGVYDISDALALCSATPQENVPDSGKIITCRIEHFVLGWTK